MSLTVLSEIIAIAGIIDYGELLLLYLGTHVFNIIIDSAKSLISRRTVRHSHITPPVPITLVSC